MRRRPRDEFGQIDVALMAARSEFRTKSFEYRAPTLRRPRAPRPMVTDIDRKRRRAPAIADARLWVMMPRLARSLALYGIVHSALQN